MLSWANDNAPVGKRMLPWADRDATMGHRCCCVNDGASVFSRQPWLTEERRRRARGWGRKRGNGGYTDRQGMRHRRCHNGVLRCRVWLQQRAVVRQSSRWSVVSPMWFDIGIFRVCVRLACWYRGWPLAVDMCRALDLGDFPSGDAQHSPFFKGSRKRL